MDILLIKWGKNSTSINICNPTLANPELPTMIPTKTVELIHQTAIIEDVVGDYVELKKQGSSYRGLSPFTSEKTPSFYVVPSKGIFKCFSSGKGGSLMTFVMAIEKVSYPEALRIVARK